MLQFEKDISNYVLLSICYSDLIYYNIHKQLFFIKIKFLIKFKVIRFWFDSHFLQLHVLLIVDIQTSYERKKKAYRIYLFFK